MQVFFYIFALLSIVSAAGVLFLRNPIHSALSLVGTFFCLGAIYVMLNAEFVAVIQVLVYAGAIMVLFLFVLMLLSNEEGMQQHAIRWTPAKGVAAVATLVVFLQIVSSFLSPAMRLGEPGTYDAATVAETGSIAVIGRLLFTEYLLPFEVISILLLVAVIGAVVIAKRRFH